MDRRDIQSPSLPTNILCLYAQRDESFYRELQAHFSIWQREGHVHWLEIGGGDDIEQTIQTQIQKADLILLLISPSFFANDLCYTSMKSSLQEHSTHQVPIVPVLARDFAWKESACGVLKALPDNEQPINSWTDHDEAYENICVGLERIIPHISIIGSNSSHHPLINIDSFVNLPDNPSEMNVRFLASFSSSEPLLGKSPQKPLPESTSSISSKFMLTLIPRIVIVIAIAILCLIIFRGFILSEPLSAYLDPSKHSNSSASPIVNQTITLSTASSPALEQVLDIPAPGCGVGVNSLQDLYHIAPFRCPSSNTPGYNPYNDFGAKDEATAIADTLGHIIAITGTANIIPFNPDCTKECIFQANIFFIEIQLLLNNQQSLV